MTIYATKNYLCRVLLLSRPFSQQFKAIIIGQYARWGRSIYGPVGLVLCGKLLCQVIISYVHFWLWCRRCFCLLVYITEMLLCLAGPPYTTLIVMASGERQSKRKRQTVSWTPQASYSPVSWQITIFPISLRDLWSDVESCVTITNK